MQFLEILKQHFSEHPSTDTMDMTIANASRQRAVLQISLVPIDKYTAYINPGGSKGARDGVQVIFYPEDPVAKDEVIRLFTDAVMSFEEHPPGTLAQSGSKILFRLENLHLTIRIRPFARGSTGVSYEELRDALVTIHQVVKQKQEDQWSNLVASVLDPDNNPRATVILSDWIDPTPHETVEIHQTF